GKVESLANLGGPASARREESAGWAACAAKRQRGAPAPRVAASRESVHGPGQAVPSVTEGSRGGVGGCEKAQRGTPPEARMALASSSNSVTMASRNEARPTTRPSTRMLAISKNSMALRAARSSAHSLANRLRMTGNLRESQGAEELREAFGIHRPVR